MIGKDSIRLQNLLDNECCVVAACKPEFIQEPGMKCWRHGCESCDEVEPTAVASPELLPKEDVKRLRSEEQGSASLKDTSSPKTLNNFLEAGPSDCWINLLNQLRDVGGLIRYGVFKSKTAE